MNTGAPWHPHLADLFDESSLTRVLLDRMAEGVSLSGADGAILYSNPALDRMFGCGAGGMRGRSLLAPDLGTPAKSVPSAEAIFDALTRTGVWEGDRIQRRADGTEFDSRLRISAVDFGGERHWLCLQAEATGPASATQALAEERARLKMATETAGIGIWDWDLGTDRMTYSNLARSISGLPATGKITIADVRRIVHPEDHPHTWEQARRAMDPAIRDRSPYEYRLVHPDGSVRWVLAHGEAIFEDGPEGLRASRYLGTLQDITARRELQEGEREAVQRLRLALAAGDMGVWDLNPASGLVTGSPQLHRILGFPEGAPIRADEVNARYAPGEYERVSSEGAACMARGELSASAEFGYLHPENGLRWLRLRYEVILDPDGLPAQVIGVVSDETERQQAEAQIRASEEELRALADALPVLVSFIDKDQRYRFMNKAHEKWFFRPREEMLGRTIREVLGEEAYAPRCAPIEAALKGSETRLDVMTPGGHGRRRDTEVHYIPRRNAGGNVDGLYAVVLDLTEQKAAHRALQQARDAAEREAAQTGAILRQLAEGVIVTDASGHILFVNEAAARIHGVVHLGVVPDDYPEAYRLFSEDGRPYPPEDLPLTRAALKREISENIRWLIRRPDGVEVLAVGSARPILTGEGQHVGAVLTLRDDTARAKAEAELRRLNQDLEAEVLQRTAERDRIWQNSNELMAVIGFEGRRRTINPAWNHLLGHEEEMLLSASFTDLSHPEDRPRLLAAVERLARGERVSELETRLRHKDGSYRTVSWMGVPGDGVFYAIGRDVTEQRRAEQALRQSQKMEALGQLTGGIAHDFNNLLQVVQGSFALILRRFADPERVRNLAEQGIQATRRGSRLASQLLAFSRSQKLEVQAVQVGSVLAGMTDLLQRSIGPLVRVVLQPVERDVLVQVDPTQLEMAVLNLAINARDAMPEGGVLTIGVDTASASAAPDLDAGDYVIVRVEDTGTGMPEDVAQRAFEPFFTTKALGQGTGLGLSQVYAMARQSGGTVHLDTRLGMGTTVKIHLRRAATHSAIRVPADPRPGTEAACRPATILVIDDDEDLRAWLASALAMLGHRVVPAATGPEGLTRLDCDPDLLIVDFAMPMMSGTDVIREVRKVRPDLPIILATGYADTGAVETVTNSDLLILRKPFELDDLEDALRVKLMGSAGRDEQAGTKGRPS